MAAEERIRKIIAEQLGVEEEDVVPDASFVEDLGADSLDTVELVMALEEEFDVEIPDEDAEKFKKFPKPSSISKKNLIHGAHDRVPPQSARGDNRLGSRDSLGVGVDKTWHAVCAGQSGIGPITRFDAAGYACRIAAEVKDFDPADHIEKKEIKKMDTFIQYAVAASQEAVDDAGLTITPDTAERVGVYIGAGIGGCRPLSSITGCSRTKGRGASVRFHSDGHRQFGLGPGGDPVWSQGPQFVRRDGLCHGESLHRGRLPDNSTWGSGRDVGRWKRIHDLPVGHCGLRRGQSAIAAQRRSGAGEPSV